MFSMAWISFRIFLFFSFVSSLLCALLYFCCVGVCHLFCLGLSYERAFERGLCLLFLTYEKKYVEVDPNNTIGP